MEQQEATAALQATEPAPGSEAQPDKKQKRSREVVSVREGRFHAWVRTVAVVGIFAAFALFFLYLAPKLSDTLTVADTALQTASDALANADKALTDVTGTIENANTIIKGLEDTMEDTDALVGEARTAIGHLDGVAQQLEEANLPETFENLNAAVNDFSGVVGPLSRLFGR